jgi:hypothetical protein
MLAQSFMDNDASHTGQTPNGIAGTQKINVCYPIPSLESGSSEKSDLLGKMYAGNQKHMWHSSVEQINQVDGPP